MRKSILRRRYLWSTLVAGLAISGLFGIAQVDVADPPQPSARALPVETWRVEAVNWYRTTQSYTGRVVPRRAADLMFALPGQVVSIAVDDGDRVGEHQAVAVLDTDSLNAEIQEQRARRAQALARLDEMLAGPRPETIAAARAYLKQERNELELLQLKLARRKQLREKRTITQEEYYEFAFAVVTAQARVDVAQARLQELLAGTRPEQISSQRALIDQFNAQLRGLQVDLQKSTLRAPYAGRIAKRFVEEGSVVAAGQPVCRFVEDGANEVWVGVPIELAAALAPGSTQELHIGSRVHAARVRTQLPELDETTRTLTVVLALDDSVAKAAIPGQTAQLKCVQTVPTYGSWLPITALERGTRGLWSCLALVAPADDLDGQPPSAADVHIYRIQRHDVEVLHTESAHVLVRGTVRPGDRVIKAGTARVVPGQLVRVSDGH